MAKVYTAPTTVSVGDAITASLYNTYVGTNVANLIVPPACRLIRTTNQSIPNGADAIVSMDTSNYDTDSMGTTGASSRITINTTGLYLITYEIHWETGGSFTRIAFVGKNGSTTRFVDLRIAPTTGTAYMSGASVASLVATDFLTPYVFQNSGGSFNCVVDSGYAGALTATWIGRTS